MKECHAGPSGGHHGMNTTARKILDAGFYWPTIFRDVKAMIQACDACQRAGNISRRDGPLKTIYKSVKFLMFGELTSWDPFHLREGINTS